LLKQRGLEKSFWFQQLLFLKHNSKLFDCWIVSIQPTSINTELLE
jgi:hypothetical protein